MMVWDFNQWLFTRGVRVGKLDSLGHAPKNAGNSPKTANSTAGFRMIGSQEPERHEENVSAQTVSPVQAIHTSQSEMKASVMKLHRQLNIVIGVSIVIAALIALRPWLW